MGPLARTHNYDHLRYLHISRTIHLLRLPQYHSIHLRRPGRLCLSSLLHPILLTYTLRLSRPINPLPPHPRRHNLLPRLSLRLCLPRPRRLYNLHTRQILQAPPRHVPTPHHLPQILSTLQIPRRGARDRRRRGLHNLPPNIILQEILPKQQQLRMGPHAAQHQPLVRRPHKQHARPHIQHPPLLHRPPNDGRAKRPLHPPHNPLPPPLSPPSPNAPLPLNDLHLRNLSRSRLHLSQPRHPARYTRIRGLRRIWADIYLLHAQSVLESVAGDGDGDEEDADDDVERALVWTSVEWDAVGWGWFGVWGCWGRGVDTEEGEGGEGEGEEQEGTLN